jgi:hypothetical protein
MRYQNPGKKYNIKKFNNKDMKYEGKEIEVLVEPFSTSNYVIYYRVKKRFNLFNPWQRHNYTWTLSVEHFDRSQPYLYNSFEEAVSAAERLKADPQWIDSHTIVQDMKYDKCVKEHKEHQKKYQKSVII